MNQQTFSKMTGISTASLSSIFNGRTNPTLMHVEAIRNKFPNINLNWLLYGEGGMFVPTANPTPTSLFDDADQVNNPTPQTVPEAPQKTDILSEGLLNFDEQTVHATPQQIANTRNNRLLQFRAPHSVASRRSAFSMMIRLGRVLFLRNNEVLKNPFGTCASFFTEQKFFVKFIKQKNLHDDQEICS